MLSYKIMHWLVITIFVSEGRKHDAGILADSNILYNLEQFAFATADLPIRIYEDPAYPLRVHLQAPFIRNAVVTHQMIVYNVSMSSVRVSVEWLIGDHINYFKFMDLKKNLKLQLSAIGKMYTVSAIIRNALTCLYSNQTS